MPLDDRFTATSFDTLDSATGQFLKANFESGKSASSQKLMLPRAEEAALLNAVWILLSSHWPMTSGGPEQLPTTKRKPRLSKSSPQIGHSIEVL